MLILNKKINILNKYCYNKNDTGSAEIQIILLTIKIEKLYNHLDKNIKDINNKLNLIKKIEKRKKLINYLIKNKKLVINNLLNDLNIDVVKLEYTLH